MSTPEARRLAELLHSMLTLDAGRAERLDAVRRFADAADIDADKAEAIAERAPDFPPGFLDPFIEGFSEEAAASMLPERVALMCQGGDKGRMLALVEFFAWLEEHAVRAKAALKALGKTTGERLDYVEILVQALASDAEARLHGHG